MRKIFTLFCLLFAAFVTTRAQLVETEPNDTLQTANFMPFDSTMTGATGTYTQLDFFKFVTPSSGILRVYTSVNVSGNVAAQPFSLDLVSKEGHIFSSLSVKSAKGTDKLDTVEWNCVAADTFYLLAHCNFSTVDTYHYSFSLHMVSPSFADDNEGNRSTSTAFNWEPLTTVQGQLGYKHETGNAIEASYYKVVTTTPGSLRIYTNAEYTTAGTHALNVGLVNKNQQLMDSVTGAIGAYGEPAMDTVTFDCMDADTFYVRINQNSIYDCGWSYSASYEIVPAVFAADAEPNNSFVQANLINAGNVKTGQSHYGTDGSEDYYHFYKPDDGFLEIDALAVSADSVSGVAKMRLYDNSQNLLQSTDVPVGSYGVPSPGVMYIATQASDSFYVRVSWPNAGYCGSYSFLITTETVAGIHDNVLTPVSVLPNPSNSSFTFDMAGVHASELQVFDMNGRLVEVITGARLQSRFVNAGASLQPGVYIARLYSGAEVSGVVRLVKTGQ